MDERPSRRKYLTTLGIAGIAGIAGCSQGGSQRTATPTRNVNGANFTFEYDSQAHQVTIQYNGGATIQAGNLQVRSSSGMQTTWSQLGSTTTGTDSQLSTGATAVLGADILNWGQAVGPSETIRLVYAAGNGPSTLGRFTPTAPSTLTSTVPSTPEPTETPPADTTPPSITAFSLSNPSGAELRTSFEANESLASIEVRISGPESATLRTGDFSEGVSSGTYTYEATYQAGSDGEYTATLHEAADGNGNDGASEQSVSLSIIEASNVLFSDDFEDGTYDDTWNVTREHDAESVTEENGIFTYSSPIDETIYEPDMTVITDQTMSGDGTHVFEAEFRIESYRRVRIFRILDAASDNSIALNEEAQNDTFVLSLPDTTVELGDDRGEGAWRTYQMTVDFDSNTVVSVTRGDETCQVDESFASGFEEYRLGIGEGNGESQFESVSIQTTTVERDTETLANFETGWNDFEVLVNTSIEGHPQQGTDANAERTTEDAYDGSQAVRVQCSMNGDDGDVVARRSDIDVSQYSTLTAWSKLVTGNTYGSPRIRIYNSDDTRIGNLDIRNQQQDVWEESTFDISSADSITVHLEASSGAGAEQEALIDYLQLRS